MGARHTRLGYNPSFISKWGLVGGIILVGGWIYSKYAENIKFDQLFVGIGTIVLISQLRRFLYLNSNQIGIKTIDGKSYAKVNGPGLLYVPDNLVIYSRESYPLVKKVHVGNQFRITNMAKFSEQVFTETCDVVNLDTSMVHQDIVSKEIEEHMDMLNKSLEDKYGIKLE